MDKQLLDILTKMNQQFEIMNEKLEEIDKQRKEDKKEIIDIIRGYNEGIGNAFLRLETAINNQIEVIDGQFKEVKRDIKGVKIEIKNVNEKIDILYSSDLLTKKILDNHEHRLTDLEISVADTEDDSYNIT